MATFMDYDNMDMDCESENNTVGGRENKKIAINPVAFKRTALGSLTSNSNLMPLQELKAKGQTTKIRSNRVPLGSNLQIVKPTLSFPSKVQPFAIFEDDQCGKENTSNFQIRDNSTLQNDLGRKTYSSVAALPKTWSINVDDDDDKESTSEEYEECKENFPVEEEVCDASPPGSLSENAVRLYTYDEEDKENVPCSPMTLDDTFNESQDAAKQAWIARNNMYNYAEYAADVYLYLRESEQRFQPKSSYIRKQPDISSDMRSILVDWLVEVSEEYKLQPETLYLTVSYIDRFLSTMSVLRSKLQLVGTASMFIAAKYEEIYPPEVKEFVYITDDTYSPKQVLRMEHLILKVLSFNLNVPTSYCFLQFLSCVAPIPKTVIFLAQYLCELTLLEAEPFLQFLPSRLASAAIALSNYTVGYATWNENLESATGYELDDLSDVIDCLYVAYRNSTHNPRRAIRQKFKNPSYHQVSTIPPPEELNCF